MRRTSRRPTLKRAGSESSSVRSMCRIDLKPLMRRRMRATRTMRSMRIRMGSKTSAEPSVYMTTSKTAAMQRRKSNVFQPSPKYWERPRPVTLRANSST
eukprot:7381758-Prymnesium_polylepis.2